MCWWRRGIHGSCVCSAIVPLFSHDSIGNIDLDGSLPFQHPDAFFRMEGTSGLDNLVLNGTDSSSTNAGSDILLASLTFDETFKSLIPLALILIPLFLGIFYGVTTLIISFFSLKKIFH